jgi:hypothetical protein
VRLCLPLLQKHEIRSIGDSRDLLKWRCVGLLKTTLTCKPSRCTVSEILSGRFGSFRVCLGTHPCAIFISQVYQIFNTIRLILLIYLTIRGWVDGAERSSELLSLSQSVTGGGDVDDLKNFDNGSLRDIIRLKGAE